MPEMPGNVEVDPGLCDGDPDNRKSEAPGLYESIRVNGQIVPVILFAKGGRYGILEGHGRVGVARRLGRKVKAVIVDEPGSDAERRRVRLNCNEVRKGMTREEQATDVLAIMDEKQFTTHKQAAEWIGIPDSTLSSILKGSELDPSDAAKLDAAGAPASLKAIIARLPDRESQLKTIEFATTPVDGKRPSRDRVVTFAGQFKPNGKKPKRQKKVTFTVKKRKITVLSTGATDTAAQLIEDLKSLINRLKPFGDAEPGGWPYIPA